MALVDAHLHTAPPEISRRVLLSRLFDLVLVRAIAKDPDRRYESCGHDASPQRMRWSEGQ